MKDQNVMLLDSLDKKAGKSKIYPYLLEPKDYAEFCRRCAKAVTREDIDNKIQFSILRIFSTGENNQLKEYKDDLELYT